MLSPQSAFLSLISASHSALLSIAPLCFILFPNSLILDIIWYFIICLITFLCPQSKRMSVHESRYFYVCVCTPLCYYILNNFWDMSRAQDTFIGWTEWGDKYTLHIRKGGSESSSNCSKNTERKYRTKMPAKLFVTHKAMWVTTWIKPVGGLVQHTESCRILNRRG